jgi:signal transduction histidine kinase
MSLEIQIFLMLGVAAVNLVLAGMIAAQDFRSQANLAFALLATAAALWGLGTSLFLYIPSEAMSEIEFLGRFNYFWGEFIPTAFLYLALVFNAARPLKRSIALLVLSPAIILVWVYFFTDLILVRSVVFPSGVRGFEYGSMDYIFEAHVWGYFAIAFFILLKKFRASQGPARTRILSIMVGTYVTLGIAGIFNIVLPHFYQIFDYISVGPIAILFWVCIMAYSIARLGLFRVRLVAVELIVAFLWVVLVFRTFLSSNGSSLALNATFLFLILAVGVLLIRSAIQGIEQNELIEEQGKSLTRVNAQQEALLYFISHEIKAYFSKIEAAFASIVEGDYGAVTPAISTVATGALADVRMGTGMVMNILNASDLKRGIVGYRKTLFDFVQCVRQEAEVLQKNAEDKGLTFTVKLPDSACTVFGDEGKIEEHVIRNLIDNAIRYTLAGSVLVEVSRAETQVRLVVEDSGVGISPEDMARLFTEGGHGKDSIRVNVHSTGYGLYIAKQVIDAHGGTIHALSSGAGKGSRFVVELPIVSA